MSTKDRLIASAQKNLEKGQIGKAVKDYQQLVELEPRVIQHRQKLADLQSRAKLNADAVSNYEIVAKHFSENGFFLKAIAVYKQIQKLDPDKTECYLRLAELNEKQGLMGNALTEYRNLVAYYERRNLLAEAVGVLQKIKVLEPDNLNVRVKIADCLARSGFREKGKAEFRELFDALGADADPAMMQRLYEVFVPIFPNDAEVHGGLARLLSRRGEHERARTLLKGLVKQSPDDPDLLEALADVQRTAGELENERLTLAHLLKKDPDRSAARLRLAQLLAGSGQGERALLEVVEYQQSLIVAGLEEPLRQLYGELLVLLPGDARIVQAFSDLTGEVPSLAAPVDVDSSGPDVEARPVASQAATLITELVEPAGVADVLSPSHTNLGESTAETAPGAEEEISLNFLEEFGELGEEPHAAIAAPVAVPSPPCPPSPPVVEADQSELELDLGEFDLEFGVSPVAEPERVESAVVEPATVVDAVTEAGGEPAVPAGDEVEVAVDFALDDLPDIADLAEVEAELPIPELALPEFPDVSAEFPSVTSSAGELLDVEEALPAFDETEPEELEEFLPDVVEAASPFSETAEEISGDELEELTEELELTAEEPQLAELEPLLELDEVEPEAELLVDLSDELSVGEETEVSEVLEAPLEEIEELEEVELISADAGEASVAEVIPEELIVVPGHHAAAEEFDAAAEFADLADLTSEVLTTEHGLDADLELLSGAMQELQAEPSMQPEDPGGQLQASSPSAAVILAPVEEVAEELHLPAGFAPAEAVTVLSPDTELEEADFYLHQGLADEAEAICRRVLQQHPAYQPALQRLEEVASLRREADRLSLPPDTSSFVDLTSELFDDKMVEEIGDVLEDRFNFDGVLSAFKEGVAAQIDKEDTESHYNLGIAYKEMGLLDDAVAEFERAMADPSRYLDCLVLKGLCLVEKGSVVDAESVFVEGLARPGLTGSERVGLQYELALLYENSGRLAEALEGFRMVAAIDHFFRDVGGKIERLASVVGNATAGDTVPSGAASSSGRNRVSFV